MSRLIYYFIILLIVGLYSVLSYVTPLYLDDWMFMANWNLTAPSPDFSLEGWKNYYLFTRDADNGRISNALAVFTSIFSPFKNIFPLLNGIMNGIILILIHKIACFNRNTNKILAIIVIWGLSSIFLPFYNLLFIADYSLNYIWGAAITLILLYYILRNGRKVWSLSGILLGIILCILAAGWHESFAVETICGLSLIIIFNWRKLNKYFYIFFTVYCASAFIFGFSPGMVNRFGWEFLSGDLLPPKRCLIFLVILILYIIIFLSLKSTRRISFKILKSPIPLCCMGVIASGYTIGMLTRNAPRAYFWPIIATIILFIFLLTRSTSVFSPKNKKSRMSITYLAVAVTIICCSSEVIWSIRSQSHFTKVWENLYGQLAESDTGIIYFDPQELSWDRPKFMLIPPIGTEVNDIWQAKTLRMFYKTPFLSFIPAELLIPGEKKELEGNLGCVLINDYIVAPYSSDLMNYNGPIPKDIELIITLHNSNEITTHALAVPFLSNSALNLYTDTLFYIQLPNIPSSQILSVNRPKL